MVRDGRVDDRRDILVQHGVVFQAQAIVEVASQGTVDRRCSPNNSRPRKPNSARRRALVDGAGSSRLDEVGLHRSADGRSRCASMMLCRAERVAMTMLLKRQCNWRSTEVRSTPSGCARLQCVWRNASASVDPRVTRISSRGDRPNGANSSTSFRPDCRRDPCIRAVQQQTLWPRWLRNREEQPNGAVPMPHHRDTRNR